MPIDQIVEERLTALERAVADLRKWLPGRTGGSDWLRQISGSVTDPEAFAEALRYGREFRHADRPADEAEPNV